MQTRFGEFVLDSDRRLLARAGRRVHVTAKAFALLEVLVAERPRAVPKRELIDRVWPDVVVAAENLKNLIAELRKAIGESSIRTVHGFGYAFGADEASPRYFLLRGSQATPLAVSVTDIGRDPECGICIDAPGVSRRHARITISDAGATLEDLGSKNGTRVGGKRIDSAVSLHNGDRVQIAGVVLTFRTSGRDASTMTEGVSVGS